MEVKLGQHDIIEQLSEAVEAVSMEQEVETAEVVVDKVSDKAKETVPTGLQIMQLQFSMILQMNILQWMQSILFLN